MELDELLDRYFEGRPATLWGRSFDVVADPEPAKVWLAQVIEELWRLANDDT